ncbi:MAG: MGMT family protein [Acidimicrobiia bacterium]|nr:MGMT family protein [Acidimicrobiia bacterium]
MTELRDALAGMATPPPRDLMPATLVEAGIADGFIEVVGPTGPLIVAFNPRGVSEVAPRSSDARFVRQFTDRTARPVFPVADMPVDLRRPLERALATGRLGRLPLDLRGQTEFQRVVLETVATIPPGEVRPYGWVARQVGRNSAYRAVGSAVAQNPVPVLVPCHRVVKSDGHIGSYRFGPAMKQRLLEFEGLQPRTLDTLADEGKVLVGNDRSRIVCFPTCSRGRRISDADRAWFRNTKAATAAGYEACSKCQPY